MIILQLDLFPDPPDFVLTRHLEIYPPVNNLQILLDPSPLRSTKSSVIQMKSNTWMAINSHSRSGYLHRPPLWIENPPQRLEPPPKFESTTVREAGGRTRAPTQRRDRILVRQEEDELLPSAVCFESLEHRREIHDGGVDHRQRHRSSSSFSLFSCALSPSPPVKGFFPPIYRRGALELAHRRWA